MASGGAAGLRAAAAIAVVLAVLVKSSQGHPREKPLCSDCLSLCNTNCTPVIAAACNSSCSLPPGQCEGCQSQVLRGCCQSFCSSSNDTSTVSSCCPSNCVSGGDCVTCSCDNCSAAVQSSCAFPCSMHASDVMRCNACRNWAAQDCMAPCMSACNDHCVKKDC